MLVARISKATKKFEKKEKKKQDNEEIKPRNLYKLYSTEYFVEVDEYFVEVVMREATKLLTAFSAAKDIEVKHDIHYQLMSLVNDPSDYFEPEITDSMILGEYRYLGI